MRAQIISMDFIATSVLYMFAVSVFFFALKESYLSTASDLDAMSDLIFSKMENVYDSEYSFIRSSHFNGSFTDFAITASYNSSKAYELYFKEYEKAAFKRLDYCIYLDNGTAAPQIILNFDARDPQKTDQYSISIGTVTPVACGTNKLNAYTSLPSCRSGAQSLRMTKPVVYGKDIMKLNILVCGEER